MERHMAVNPVEISKAASFGAVGEGVPKSWIGEHDLARALQVSVGEVRQMARAGVLQRRKRDGVYMVRKKEQRTRDAGSGPGENARSGTGQSERAASGTGAVLMHPETRPGRAEGVAVAPEKRADTVILRSEDIEYLQAEVSAEALAASNRELTRLVESVMERWREASLDQRIAGSEMKRAMDQALQVQQCLGLWQEHAAALHRQAMAAIHTAQRALDVADEAIARRWTWGKRRGVLQERLRELRQQST